MQKKMLSLCIALAVSNNTLAGTEIQSKNKIEETTCPTKISELSKEQRAKLPKKCLTAEDDTMWEWIAGGAAAAVAGIVAIASGGGGGGGGDSHSSGPIPDPTPDPIPDPVPDPTPDPTHVTVQYSNGALLDKTAKTLFLNGVTYSYAQDGDHYVLTAPNGSVLYTDSAHWSVDANNDLSIKGKNADGLYWSYDASGKFIQADANTKVVEGDGTSTTVDTPNNASGKDSAGTIISGDNTNTDISGGTSATDGGTGTKVDGDDAVINNTGDTTASGTGSTGTDITGDGAAVDNTGKTDVVDGGTGTKIAGDDAVVDNKGDSTAKGADTVITDITGDNAAINNDGKTDITDGGTGTKIDGKGADVVNTGDTTATGTGSTGTEIKGDDAVIANTGNTTVADGGTGTKIDGNNAKIDNKGDTSASGTDSKAVVVTGDGAQVNNQGNTTVTDGATGTQITGNDATVNIKGDDTTPAKIDVSGAGKGVEIAGNNANLVIDNASATVDGAGSVLVDITGDDAKATLGGDIHVTNGAKGIDIEGARAKVDTAANIFVQDLNSVGVNIYGDNATFNNTGSIDVKNNASAVVISGDSAVTTLNGDINVTSVLGSDDVLQLANGVVVSGNNGTTKVVGNINISNQDISDSDKEIIAGVMSGVNVKGENNVIDVDGAINVETIGNITSVVEEGTKFIGAKVEGSGNQVNITGGVNLKKQVTKHIYNNASALGLYITGDNTVTVSGLSSVENNSDWLITTQYAYVSDGGELLLTKDSVLNFDYKLADKDVGAQSLGEIVVSGLNSTLNNAGIINIHSNGGVILQVNDNATGENTGVISSFSTADDLQSKSAIVSVLSNSRFANSGAMNIISNHTPSKGSGDKGYSIAWAKGIYYGIQSTGPGSIADNTHEGEITLAGTGLYGVAATQSGTALNEGNISLNGFIQQMDEMGNVTSQDKYSVEDKTAYYRGAGMIAGTDYSASVGGGATALNTGNIEVKNSGFGMLAMAGGTVTNQGNITLNADATTVSDGTQAQLIGMGAISGGKAVNDTIGVININTDLGKAFYVDSGKGSVIVNKGIVNYNGAKIDNSDSHMGSTPLATDPVSGQKNLSSVRGYQVGTNSDGSAGTFHGSNLDVSEVTVNSGFTAGTADKTASFDNVFQGTNIQGAENIKSDTVMWSAEGKTDASGNVDVTMSKKGYQEVADTSVSNVAGALEAGYTNNALFNSLNLKTAGEVTNAMKQLSGMNATSAFNEARVLSNRFTMLEDNAVVTSSGLGFNVVAKGDKRAELGNNTQYDMMALSQKFTLSPNQDMKLQYGIARLDGNGDVKNAGDNGLTGGYSQFFGLEHSLKLNENYNLDTALRYDNQQLDSSRSIQYSGVNQVADSSNSQQYMELKSGVSRGFALSDTLNFKPSAGVKLRHTIEGGVKETGANDFNLSMDSSSETAVDAVIGMQLDYAGKNGWSASAKLEGGPNLSYSKSQRTAELQGAKGQRFSVDDGQKGGGINGLAQVGVHYNLGNTTMGVDAYNWQEDDANDKGLNMNVKVNF